MEEIVIRIGKDGKINLNVAGIKGGACKSLTAAMEKALGMVEGTTNTGEYYEQQQTLDENQSLGQ